MDRRSAIEGLRAARKQAQQLADGRAARLEEAERIAAEAQRRLAAVRDQVAEEASQAELSIQCAMTTLRMSAPRGLVEQFLDQLGRRERELMRIDGGDDQRKWQAIRDNMADCRAARDEVQELVLAAVDDAAFSKAFVEIARRAGAEWPPKHPDAKLAHWED